MEGSILAVIVILIVAVILGSAVHWAFYLLALLALWLVLS